jgi:archaellum biogenesis ATPase FlaH
MEPTEAHATYFDADSRYGPTQRVRTNAELPVLIRHQSLWHKSVMLIDSMRQILASWYKTWITITSRRSRPF